MATAGQNDSSIVIEQVVTSSGLTEGPHWDSKTQKLLFVDIWAKKFCCYDPITSKVLQADLGDKPVGVVVPVENSPNLFVVGFGTDFVLVSWDCKKSEKITPTKVFGSVEVGLEGHRINDGKCDPLGRFWAGTMSELDGEFKPSQGTLYCLDSKLQIKSHYSPVGISNGLAWNLKDEKFYYIDSLSYQVAVFDFNSKNGTIANRKVVFDLQKNNLSGFPDGMTIDADGNLWVAVWEGSRILQIEPKSGKLLRTIYMPAKRVTSVAFGGPGLDILYVTTAGYGFNIPDEKTPADDKMDILYVTTVGYVFGNSTEKTLADDTKGGSISDVKGLGVTGLSAKSFKL